MSFDVLACDLKRVIAIPSASGVDESDDGLLLSPP